MQDTSRQYLADSSPADKYKVLSALPVVVFVPHSIDTLLNARCVVLLAGDTTRSPAREHQPRQGEARPDASRPEYQKVGTSTPHRCSVRMNG